MSCIETKKVDWVWIVVVILMLLVLFGDCAVLDMFFGRPHNGRCC